MSFTHIDLSPFEVDTIKPYSADYTACVKEALAELRDDVRPELKEYLDCPSEAARRLNQRSR